MNILIENFKVRTCLIVSVYKRWTSKKRLQRLEMTTEKDGLVHAVCIVAKHFGSGFLWQGRLIFS